MLILTIALIWFQSKKDYKTDQYNNLREASCEKSIDCVSDGVTECVTSFNKESVFYLYEDRCLIYKRNCIGNTRKYSSLLGVVLNHKFFLTT